MKLNIPQLDAMRAGIELYGATDFSIFSLFSPNENALSRIVVELFDPAGSHGQGLLFLNAMLSAIDVPRVNQREAIRAQREVLTRAKRRIDIVIQTPRYVIGIENKPWASQQPNQLKDYIDELSADLRGRIPILIFLSDKEEKSAKGEVINVPFYSRTSNISLHAVLSSVVKDIKANKPKEFVEEFIFYIDDNFGEGQMSVETDAPYIDAVSAEFDVKENRKALAAFLLSQETLHLRIINEIGDYILSQIKVQLSDDFIPISDAKLSDCLYQQYRQWGIRHTSWPLNCEVALESQKYFFNEIKFGVKAPDEKRLRGQEKKFASLARIKLEGNIPISGGRKTIYWPWEELVWDPYWGAEFAARLILQSPTGLVDDHPEVQELAQKFVDILSSVHELLKS
ncbi:hypothetical protein FHS77_002828 [Paenochrobactrum gallinarii]|uniref:PD-(D/E)XK nuclease family protein n=1 Tax=Paenochrobactrum gallinarii TaxID=643673 RepID=A0A841LY14_9HYPH|nr:PD-(D/E)XK nuclease family protein [Paenochrobactrum gallinarii]MBB6262256.1 hypothetical protein [Paenochrobactrum gallinarii]